MRWYKIPLICFASILVFGAITYVVLGVDLFPGHDGGRWITLAALTAGSGFLWLVASGQLG